VLRFKKVLLVVVAAAFLPLPFALTSCANIKDIKPIQADGFHSDGHIANYAIDGDKTTYYETPLATSTSSTSKDPDDCFRRNIDFTFNGVYNISDINIFQCVGGKYQNTYNHYEIYVSSSKDDWKKIAYKTNNDIATESGDHYRLGGVNAHIVRVNLSFNS
jgi:hypothetical protein